jgi:beta-lactamase regulating signal transducer with metallopeptidase domain
MTTILESALRTAITVALVWVLLRLFRVTHVVSQKIAWGLVLVAAIAMPSVMRWHAFKFPLPASLRSYAAVRPPAKAQVSSGVQMIEGATPNSAWPAIKSPDPSSNRRPHIAGLHFFVATVYATICAILLLRLLLGLTCAFRVWHRARPVFDLPTTMRVRSSDDVSIPLTIGFGVILPSSFNNWDRPKLHMVLAHERSHIRQADFFLQLLARLHAAVFWFSLPAWWLQKELADLGEAISDHAAIIHAPDRCSYAEVLLEFAAMYRRPQAGIPMAQPRGIDLRIERILNDTLFRCAFKDRKRRVFVAAAAFSIALLVSTTHFVVRAAGRVSRPNPTAGQETVQKSPIELTTEDSSEGSIANPRVELLTPVAESEHTAAMQEADLIQQRARDLWMKAAPKGMNLPALRIGPDTLSQSRTTIEFSVAWYGHLSDLALVHASGQVSLDRMAWGALTGIDLPHSVPGLPDKVLRYRITFAYDNRVADQLKGGERPAIAQADQNTGYQINLSWPNSAPQRDGGSSKNIGIPPYNASTFGPLKLPPRFAGPLPENPGEDRKISGCVVGFIVGEDGIPQKVHVIHDLGVECDRDFVNSVEHLRFMPATANGEPVPASMTIEVLATHRPHYRIGVTNIE